MAVSCEVKEQILHVGLNNSAKKNAFDPQMIGELTRIFSQTVKEENPLAVHLFGHGDCFCAGADLAWMKSMADYTFEENLKDSKELHDMFAAIMECEFPVVTSVHGYVMGGATGLVAVSDIVIAEENTQFCFSEVKLGLAPAVISPFVLRKMNLGLATELMLSAKMFGAEEALRGGLVNYVEAEAGMEAQRDKVLARIKKAGPEAIRATKNLILTMTPIQKSVAESTVKTIAERRVSPEGQEGLKAFFEKRPPQWTGESP